MVCYRYSFKFLYYCYYYYYYYYYCYSYFVILAVITTRSNVLEDEAASHVSLGLFQKQSRELTNQ
jgi:hypothetical protein